MDEETAFATDSPPGLTPEVTPDEEPPVQLAQAMPPPGQAMTPGAPPVPTRTPQTAPQYGPQNYDPAGDEDREFNIAEEREQQRSAILRSHKGDNEVIQKTMDHPELQNLIEAKKLLAALAAKNSPDYKLSKPIVDKMESRIRADIDKRHTEELNKMKAEASASQIRYENTGARIKTAEDVDKMLGIMITGMNTRLKEGDDKSRKQAEYTLETSPIKTMKDPDGTYRGLRDAIANTVALNPGRMVDTTIAHVLKIGSPVGSNEDGSKGRGYNGHTGKGAAYYDVIGSDPAGNKILRVSDGTKLIMAKADFDRLKLARTAGYQFSTAWEKKQAQIEFDKKNDDWFTRNVVRPLTPSKGYLQ